MNEWTQIKLLTVHFFRRFFDNDLLTPGADPHAVVIRALATLATPGMMIAMYLMPRYVNLYTAPPLVQELARRSDQMLFITLSTTIMGFVAALQWEALFPDRADYIILTPLPIRQRTAFAAKVASLLAFLGMFTLAINLMPAVFFPLIAPHAKGSTVWVIIQFALANSAALASASAFIFLASMAIQGLLMNSLPERWFRITSGYARWLLMGTMVTFLLLYPRATQLLKPGQQLTVLRWYPPAWFVALSDHWLGQRNTLVDQLAARAIEALEITFLAAAILYVIAYRRHVVQSLESLQAEGQGGRIVEWIFARLLARHPIELGVSLFTFHTLFRSRAHKLIFEAYMGVAAALVVWELVSLFARRSYSVALQPIPELLCIPLVLSFILLSAMRLIYGRPAEVRANLLFRVAENAESWRGLKAAGRVMIFIGIVPVTLPLIPLHAWLWGWQIAWLHFAYCVLLALILRGTLLLNFRKIPFTCTLAPAGPNGVVFGTSYFFLFTIYAYSMAKLESWMFADTWRNAKTFAALLVILIVIEKVRAKLLEQDHHLMFEEDLDPAVRTLGLGQ